MKSSERPMATTFDELILPIAQEAPHALVLDWYRRLELTLRSYLASRGLRFHDGPRAEAEIATDPLLGATIAAMAASLRTTRNRLAHGWAPITPADAETFARSAFAIMGKLMRAEDAHSRVTPAKSAMPQDGR